MTDCIHIFFRKLLLSITCISNTLKILFLVDLSFENMHILRFYSTIIFMSDFNMNHYIF